MAAPSRLQKLDNLRLASLDVAFATAFSTLLTGSFIVGFIQHLGGSDLWIGLVSGIPALAGLMQIPGAAFGRSHHSFKKFVQVGGGLWRLLHVPFIALALIAVPNDLRLALLVLCIALAGMATQFVGPTYNEWIGRLVPERSRGWYFSQRTLISTAVGVTVGMGGAFLLDQFRGTPRESQGFALVFALAALMGLISWIYFQKMADITREEVEKVNLKSIVNVVKEPFQNKNFRQVMVFIGVFWIGSGFAGNLFSAYALESLGMPFTVLQLTSVTHAIGTVLTVKIWGFLADRYGNKPVLALLVLGVSFTPFMWLATGPELSLTQNSLILILGHVFPGIFWSGIGVTTMNLFFATSEPEKRANYLASVLTVQALFSFIAPMMGSTLMTALREPMGAVAAYKVIFIVTTVGRFVSFLFLLPIQEHGSTSLGKTIKTLSQVSPKGVAALRAMRKGADDRERETAIRQVGQAQLTLATDELAAALRDPSPRVRREAAEALSRLNTSEAAEALIRFIDEHPDLIEEETLVALGFTPSPNSAAILTRFLKDPSPILRRAAAKALGRVNDPAAVEPLSEAARQPGDPDLRRAAIQALRIMGAAEPDHYHDALFDQHPSIRTAAAEAVAELQITELADPLRQSLEWLKDEGSSETAYALGVVGKLEDVSTIVQTAQASVGTAKRRRCILGVARLLGLERETYRLMISDEVDRDTTLLQWARPYLKKNPVLQEAMDTYSENEHKAMLLLCQDERMAGLLPLAEAGINDGFLVILQEYLRKIGRTDS